MADLDGLTDAQRSALEQYIAVTSQDAEAAIPVLRRSEWSVQLAITRFFDGEPATDPVAEAIAAQPQDVRRQETLLNGFSSSQQQRGPELEAAPRIVPENDGQLAYRSNPVMALLFTPISLTYALISRIFRLFGYLFPFLPRLFNRVSGTTRGLSARRNADGRIALKPRDAALRLIREVEEEHGNHGLPFFEDGYAQALDTAKRELKFLLVVLISPEHDDTSSFIRETLLDSSTIDYIKSPANNILVWAGTVQDAEAYQVSTALSCTKFPFSAVIVHTPSVSSTAMSIVQRITGPMPASEYISKIQRTIEQYNPGLTRTRNARAEQNASRTLRQQQDSAYERSLAQDRERARRRQEEERRKREEEEKLRREEQARENYERNISQWRRWRAATIKPEPSAAVKEVVRISLRMPSGERVIRRFTSDTTVEELYAFIECYELVKDGPVDGEGEKPADFEHSYSFKLVSPMPREVFEVEMGGSLQDRIGRSGNLIVERTDFEDGQEEED